MSGMFGTEWAMWSAPASPLPVTAKPPEAPEPPKLTQGSTLTVDDAWGLFGIAKKRASKDEVKKRYLAFVSMHHPDKHPEDTSGATTRLMQANLAFKLLEKHCKW